MARFTTRVELHGAKLEEDYEKLHSEMAKFGFKRTVTSDKGVTYKLPTAEYDIEGAYTIDQIRIFAGAAAAKVRPKYAVLVTEVLQRAWDGLDIVK